MEYYHILAGIIKRQAETVGENMGKVAEQEAKIYQMLKNKKTILLSDAMEELGVSESTARRLFTRMDRDGKAIRIHGGLHIAPNNVVEYSFENYHHKFEEEKQRIGEYAASLVEPADIVFMDSGTTILQFAIKLAERLGNGELEDLTVTTNSIAILELLAPYCNIYLMGGKYRLKRKDFAGLMSERMAKGLQFKKCFLGADGIDLDDGFMGMDVETTSLAEIIMQRSEKVFVLADSSKFSERSFINYGNVECASMIITDSNISGECRQKLEDRGVNYIGV